MTTRDPPVDTSWVTESPDRPQVPAEIVFLLVVLTLTIIFSVAGIPGEADPVASDGSDALRQGWMEAHNAAHAGEPLVVPDPTVDPTTPERR